MAKALPPHPNIDWLRKAAKDRLTELRARRLAAKLHEAQRAIANDYGFNTWRALKTHVDTVSIDGRITAAITQGNAHELAELLTAHPHKLQLTAGQWQVPLLHFAAAHGQRACVDVLLDRGFDVNTRDRLDNATALHWAAQDGHLDVVRRLLAAGADIDGEGDAHEIGVIGWATCFRDVRDEVAEFLLEHGAKPTLFSAVALGRGDLVRQLVAADPTLLASRKMSRFEHYRTPLHLAVLKNRPDMVELLLELGADPHVKDSRGNTSLNEASLTTDRAIADLLVNAGADPREATVNRFQSATPILSVKNVLAALDYYVEKLGFEKRWDWGNPITFACVGRDEVTIFLCGPGDGPKANKGGQGKAGMWLSIFVQDVDALYEDYKRRGAIIRQKPTNFPWGVREMNVQDLDGHRLRMGSDATGPSDGIELCTDP